MTPLLIDYIQEIKKAQTKADIEKEKTLKLLFQKEALTTSEILTHLGFPPKIERLTPAQLKNRKIAMNHTLMREKKQKTSTKISSYLRILWLNNLIEIKKRKTSIYMLNPQIREEYKALKTLVTFLENLDKKQIELPQEEKQYINKALSILKELLEPLEEGDNGGKNSK